ncbi:MAG: outer membrane beta-barrel protein [Chitinophagaceae bacterium]|nr:outer membrane beta-barrel protein [Chitinophagaceae bacterium]
MKYLRTAFLPFLLSISLPCLSQMSAAAGLTYGTDFDQPGIYVKGRYLTGDRFAISLVLNRFFNHRQKVGTANIQTQLSFLNINVEYAVTRGKLEVYPIAGLCLGSKKTSFQEEGYEKLNDQEPNIGFNAGLGGLFRISKRWSISIEPVYSYAIWGSVDQLGIHSSIVWHFQKK